MECKYIIYGLVDPRTELVYYIGKSSSGFKRPGQHRENNSLIKKSLKNDWLNELINSGYDYSIVTLETIPDPNNTHTVCWWWTGLNCSALNDRERWWIAYGRCFGWPLTNESDGGEGHAGRKASAETRAKLKAAKATPEAREELRLRALRRRHSPETKEKIRQLKLGTKASEETKRKMSLSQTGKKRKRTKQFIIRPPHSPETKLLIAMKKRGTKMSPESSEKKRQRMTTPEQLARMRGDNNPMRNPEIKRKVMATREMKRKLGLKRKSRSKKPG